MENLVQMFGGFFEKLLIAFINYSQSTGYGEFGEQGSGLVPFDEYEELIDSSHIVEDTEIPLIWFELSMFFILCHLLNDVLDWEAWKASIDASRADRDRAERASRADSIQEGEAKQPPPEQGEQLVQGDQVELVTLPPVPLMVPVPISMGLPAVEEPIGPASKDWVDPEKQIVFLNETTGMTLRDQVAMYNSGLSGSI
jgi:hypothetical protein